MDAVRNLVNRNSNCKSPGRENDRQLRSASAERPAAHQLWLNSARNRARNDAARNDPGSPHPTNEKHSPSAPGLKPESTDNRASDKKPGHTESELEKLKRELTDEIRQLREAINDLKQ